MTKADRIIAELSEGARQAITLAAGTHQGAEVHWVGIEGKAIGQELTDAGLIGRYSGLTMLGSIVAGRMRAKLEEELLG